MVGYLSTIKLKEVIKTDNMYNEYLKKLIEELYENLPEARTYNFSYRLENEAIRIEGNRYDEVIDLENKGKAEILDELINKMKELIKKINSAE